jgi:hypothetical protein
MFGELEKQQTKERKQNTKYTKPENITMFLLTQATLIKNEFMTLIVVCSSESRGGGGGGGGGGGSRISS